MKSNKKLFLRSRAFLAMLLLFALPMSSQGAETPADRVIEAADVLAEVMAIPESAIPYNLLADAYGIAIIPQVIKAGFVIGVRHGTGVVCVRDSSGRWSNPSFISLTGGSLGWQIGGQSTDLILVFRSPRSIEGMMKGKFMLGADAAVAAGPVGRRVEGATDAALKAEILSYSRTRGFFAGVSLEGSALRIDYNGNAVYYGKPYIRAEEIFSNREIAAPQSAVQLRRSLEIHAP